MGKLVILFCCLALAATSALAAPRVVGGQNATPDQFPHQISLQIGPYRSHNCGGSIISEDWVVTAAHCVDNRDPSAYTVAAGSNRYKNVVTRKVKRIISHENYGNFQNDIALLEITPPFEFTNSLNKIEILKDEIPDDGKIVISGWGRISSNGPIPDHLQFNDKLTKSNADACRSATGNIYFDGIICLNHQSNNGACFGDSGGPALYDNKLAGIANFVMGGCGSSAPDGYCKISYFINWINRNSGLKL